MKLKPYEHKAQYYETDQMGIIHHSNYIRWFEEARIDFMSQGGLSYECMEAEGIMSPVLGISCTYKQSVRFGETAVIVPYVKEYNGIKLTIGYTVTEKESGKLCCTGESKHCFLMEGKPVSLKKSSPHFNELFNSLMAASQEE